ncbi:hypothetical protein V1264_017730 [Littorina saxatilis]|uniref:Uncharacterized protein n=2 Tax=Littorina saxatilis TaxID=31220 RepID=A0AAN9BN75_9CAEN
MCVNVEKEEDDLSPLTQDVENRDGQLWLVANRTLMSLNLMRNKMSERGLKLLLAAVEAQVISNVVTNVRRQREDHATGLYRLEVLRNAVSDNCPAATELRRLMRSRDPLLRSPRMDLEKLIVTPCAIPIML